MSSVVIAGNTSGTVTLAAPDIAGTTTLTLPATSGTVLAPSGGTLTAAQGGTGLTSVGTSGNVLTSNGTAWVSSALPAGGVTSLNGQTGAITNTDLYAIGSYVTGRPQNTTNYAKDSTIAGSSLYSPSVGAYWNGSTWAISGLGSVGADLVNTGTWRCVSRAFGSADGASGLWVRIS